MWLEECKRCRDDIWLLIVLIKSWTKGSNICLNSELSTRLARHGHLSQMHLRFHDNLSTWIPRNLHVMVHIHVAAVIIALENLKARIVHHLFSHPQQFCVSLNTHSLKISTDTPFGSCVDQHGTDVYAFCFVESSEACHLR